MIRAYHQPQALEDALQHIARGATPVAGATGLYTAKSKRDLELVDVTRCGLDRIEVSGDRISIGAAVTLEQLASAPLPGMAGALLRRGARAVASRPLRNMITVGGNLAHLVYWADLPVVLLALDAEIEVQRAGQAPSLVAVEQLLQRGTQTWEGGLISRVLVPVHSEHHFFGHERFSRTAADYSLATICCALRYQDGHAHDVRLSVGALQNRPLRVPAVEQMLEGQQLDDARIEAAVASLLQHVTIAPNFRAPVEYRRELLTALSRRALRTAWSWASREN